jgi:hypothetical protein
LLRNVSGKTTLPSGWREALTLIARRSRDSFQRHPWALAAMTEAQIGPNGMSHLEQSVAAVAGLELDVASTFEIISLVDEYVFGYAVRQREPGPEDPNARERWLAQVSEYIDEQLATGDYPQLAGLIPEGGMAALWERMHESGAAEDRFERASSVSSTASSSTSSAAARSRP